MPRTKRAVGEFLTREENRPGKTVYKRFKLAKYANAEKRLLPSEELAAALWEEWRSVPWKREEIDHCVVLQMDFGGLRDVEPAAVDDCLVYFLGGAIVGLRPFYVIFENIADQVMLTTLQSQLNRAELVVVAKKPEARKSQLDYTLIGHYERIERKYLKPWLRLAAEGAWGDSSYFITTINEKGGVQRLPTAILGEMYEAGVILRHPDERPIFRAPVPIEV